MVTPAYLQSDVSKLLPAPGLDSLGQLVSQSFSQLEQSPAVKSLAQSSGFTSVDAFLPGLPTFRTDVSAN
jgi:hypothetical protein